MTDAHRGHLCAGLSSLEEIVDGLDPARMERKFGALSADERLVLGELRAGLRADLAEVRRAMETDRTP